MLEDIVGIATQAGRIFQLAQENGIEMNWKLLAMMGASWTVVEAVRRAGKGGGCIALRTASAAWKWWKTERPLSVEERALLDCLASGVYNPGDDTLSGIDGTTVACLDGRRLAVLVGDQDVSDVITERLQKKIVALIDDHKKLIRAQEREAARASLVKLTRKAPQTAQAVSFDWLKAAADAAKANASKK